VVFDPPKIGSYQVISPRTCPDCPTDITVWRALAMDGYTPDMLSAAQRATIERILGEPGSIAVPRGCRSRSARAAVGPGGRSTSPRYQDGNAVALDAWQNEPMTLLGFGRCRLHAIVG
jgi:hypothetical protein